MQILNFIITYKFFFLIQINLPINMYLNSNKKDYN